MHDDKLCRPRHALKVHALTALTEPPACDLAIATCPSFTGLSQPPISVSRLARQLEFKFLAFTLPCGPPRCSAHSRHHLLKPAVEYSMHNKELELSRSEPGPCLIRLLKQPDFKITAVCMCFNLLNCPAVSPASTRMNTAE